MPLKTTILLFSLVLFSRIVVAQDSTYYALVQRLFTIDADDQEYRNQLDEVSAQFGYNSKEYKLLCKNIREKDSINLIKVEAILNQYGWLGADKIGSQGNTTLFMVIQHSNIKTQEKYLPMMRAAVKNKNAKASELALLEDRVALRQGKQQIYGSQLSFNEKTNVYFVLPIVDPVNLDQRRKEAGLPTMAVYLSEMGLQWDLEQYKKDLPEIEIEFFK